MKSKKFNSKKRTATIALLFVIFALFFSGRKLTFAQQENLNLFNRWLQYSDAKNALYHHLAGEAFSHLDQRTTEIAGIRSKKDWQERQEQVRRTLLRIVGPFPDKTPLRAKVVDTIQKKDYRLEKIIYESQPEFYVTACLFVPKGLKEKTAAIIYCSGHTGIAFRDLPYQRAILNLVKKGFIVLAFDPVGQGERLQYYDAETGGSRVGGPTLEHSYPGAQCFLSGSSQARYMIWDGIRAVDYLLTRNEVDPNRIGITGRSGGGTQSAYIAAFDNRIAAAAPECYITSFRRLFQSIGPQDAEQNFYHGIASGIDHADLLEVRAPKPALMITTTRDFFSIQGAGETAAEVRKIYSAFGKQENFNMVEDDAEHESTHKNREAMYAFFQKFLKLPGDPADEEVAYLTGEELQITKTGQVLSSLGGKTVFDLNRAALIPLLKKLDKSRAAGKKHLANIKSTAQELSGFIRPVEIPQPVFSGRYSRGDYCIEKYFIRGEGDYPVPFILMIPTKMKATSAVIYLNPAGKNAGAAPGGRMEWLVKKGNVVLAPDLIGTGEMGPGAFKGDAYNFKMGKASFNIWFAAIQVGRSLVGIHAGDIIRLVNYLGTRTDLGIRTISVIAKNELCPALTHAAVFDDRIEKIALIKPFNSYQSLVTNRYYRPSFMLSAVANALPAYDLPDLYAALSPRKLLLINVTDQNGNPAGNQELKQEFEFVKSAFAARGGKSNFKLRRLERYQNMHALFSWWLK